MSNEERKLRVIFIHPDLGIGGAERLVVDAALGLQRLGHTVDIYTSHHDPGHAFEETCDGTLRVHHIRPPFPRSLLGKLHILFAHLRQAHLTAHLLRSGAAGRADVVFVDQLATCVPLLRLLARRRVVFYCHFPDKLLAEGAYVEGVERRGSLVKRLYRLPMDWFEEWTTGLADVLLANSQFTVRVFKAHFSVPRTPRVIYPGINIDAYEAPVDVKDDDVTEILSDRPTLLSLNRFEKKKNIALALDTFAVLRHVLQDDSLHELRLVLAGGYDPRLRDNVETLQELLWLATQHSLSYYITSPSSSAKPPNLPSNTAPSPVIAAVVILLNFTTAQRSALLSSPSTRVLLYTPANEHFGIGPVEGMVAGVPVLACDSGGPTESVAVGEQRTGWLCPPDAARWAEVLLEEILAMPTQEREALSLRAKRRARELFGMEAMAKGMEEALYHAVRMGPVEVYFALHLLIPGISLLLFALAVHLFMT